MRTSTVTSIKSIRFACCRFSTCVFPQDAQRRRVVARTPERRFGSINLRAQLGFRSAQVAEPEAARGGRAHHHHRRRSFSCVISPTRRPEPSRTASAGEWDSCMSRRLSSRRLPMMDRRQVAAHRGDHRCRWAFLLQSADHVVARQQSLEVACGIDHREIRAAWWQAACRWRRRWSPTGQGSRIR